MPPRTTTRPRTAATHRRRQLLHKVGCPADRVETFDAVRPANPAKGKPEEIIEITRCVDCAEQVAAAPGTEIVQGTMEAEEVDDDGTDEQGG